MALTIGELVAYITADNRGFRRGVRRSQDDLERFQRDANGRLHDMRGRFVADGDQAGRGFGRGILRGVPGLGRLAGAVGGAVGLLAELTRTAVTAGLGIATIGTTAVAAAPLLAPVAAAIAEIGSAALAAAPAALALFAAFKIGQAALTAIFAEGTAARKALEPLTAVLDKATEAGSAAAARGIRPLAEQLRRVVQPTVTRFMVGVGNAANRVQREFLGWAKSTDGIRTLRGILEPISASMQRLAPDVAKVAIAFTRLLGRIMGVSTAAGTSGLTRILDALTAKLNSISAESVQRGMDTLARTFRTVMSGARTVVGWIEKLVQAYRTYTTEFRLVADAVSVAAIIFGGPIVAAIGAAGLIIRHFDELKAAWERLKAAFSGGGGGGPLSKAFQDLKAAGETVFPALKTAFEQIKTAVLPPLREIWTVIQTELVPAFAEFQKAAAPVVAWLVSVLGPVVATVFAQVINVIKGAIQIIAGIFKVFTAILTGDWGKAWEGIQQIARGAGTIIAAIFRALMGVLKGIWNLLIGILLAVWKRGLEIASSGARAIVNGVARLIRGGVGLIRNAFNSVKNAIVGFFKGAGSWLVSAGRRILDGLISGIRSAIGNVRKLLGSVTGMIPDWKGPMSVDMRLLEPSGQAIMSGLMSGIAGAVPELQRMLSGVTGGIAAAAMPAPVLPPGAPAGANGGSAGAAPTRVVLDVRGGDDALVKVIRSWVRENHGGNVQAALGQR